MRYLQLLLVVLTLLFSTFAAMANEPLSASVFRLISSRLSSELLQSISKVLKAEIGFGEALHRVSSN